MASKSGRAPEPDGIVIRRAALGDLDAVEALETAVFFADELSRRSLRHYIGTPTAVFLVLERDGVVVGDALLAFRRNSTLARLYSLAIDPASAGKGLGRRLLAQCEDEARNRGATALNLEVREENAPAIQLYRKAGYDLFGRRESYYEDGATALRFRKLLKPDKGGENG